jgi:hypothetical protein
MADERIEWLLPWWWSTYQKKNRRPVAFVDIGLSDQGKQFCEQRGVTLSLELPEGLDAVSPHSADWKRAFGPSVLEDRKRWNKMPFAFLATPFEKTLWLDLDCEVLQPLDELFALDDDIYLAVETDDAVCRERTLKIVCEDETVFNTGVVLYRHGIAVIERWARLMAERGTEFFTEQHALSRLIYTDHVPVSRLPDAFHWRMCQGINEQAAIVHWNGPMGKECIRRYGGLAGHLRHSNRVSEATREDSCVQPRT